MQLINLKTDVLGKNFLYYDEIDSTQKEIWRLIENGSIINGTLIMSDIQTNGVGTHGRIWHTDESNNIAFSFYMETNCSVKYLDGITVKIAEILTEVFKKEYGISLDIKRPNDLFFNNKKIGGILTESKVIRETVKYLVVGIGINTDKSLFTDDIKDIATSIKKEFGINVDRFNIIACFCNKFEDEVKRRLNK